MKRGLENTFLCEGCFANGGSADKSLATDCDGVVISGGKGGETINVDGGGHQRSRRLKITEKLKNSLFATLRVFTVKVVSNQDGQR